MLTGAILALLASSPGIDLEEMLRKPVSAATLAALVEFREDPRVAPRWTAGLTDPRPEVRAAAARAIHVAGLSGSGAAALSGALATEMDPIAAGEQIRALATLGTEEQLRALPAAAQRIGGVAENDASLGLARRLGLRALTEIPGFRELHVYDNADVARVVTRGQREAVTALPSLALGRGDTNLFAAALAQCRRLGVATPGVLLAAVQSDSPQMRAKAFWHLTFTPPAQLPAEVMAAAALTPEARAQSPDPETAFVYELLRRHQGEPKQDAAAGLAALYRERGPSHPLNGSDDGAHLCSLLLDAEVKAIVAGLVGESPLTVDPAGYLQGVATRDRFVPSAGQQTMPMRTPDGFSMLLARDALSLLGCKATEPSAVFGAEMTFGPDGRSRQTRLIIPEGSNPNCAAAARLAFVNALAPPDHSDFATAEPLVLVLPLEASFLACPGSKAPPALSLSAAGVASSPRVGGRIKEPRKLHDVKPIYPKSLVNARVQGTVVVEATISPEGCVADMQVLRSPHAALAWEALRAVAGWRYTPTLLNGEAVPVIMTVTVNFRLR